MKTDSELFRLLTHIQDEVHRFAITFHKDKRSKSQTRSELDSIVSETKTEEENLRQKALELEPLIDAYTLAAFKRIRKNARNGLGIVTVQRNACGGCFNRIPPQRQLEIKMHKKIIVCEYCGRIMIDAQLAGLPEPEQEAPAAKKPRTSRRTAKEKEE